MAIIPVSVKWAGQKTFEVEVDTADTGYTFKEQIYSITSVEPHRQKVLVKGGPLKDEQDMSQLGLKPKQTIMLMGSATELPSFQAIPIFMEDVQGTLSLESNLPNGLINLGNTCYMNSTLQLLNGIPELRTELQTYPGVETGGDLTGALRHMYKMLHNGNFGPLPPAIVLNDLRLAYPQFAQQSRNGHGYAQQDAEECWSQILYTLRQKLKAPTARQRPGVESSLDVFMAGRMKTIMTCTETDAEPAVETEEPFLRLNCHIGGSTNYMIDGIKDSLTDNIEKNSNVLGRNAAFVKKSAVSRLPKYLNVNFVRFFFKAGIQKKAKILRKVGFPFEFDATELCTDDLRKKIAPIRDRVREIQKAEEDAERARQRTKTQLTDSAASNDEIDNRLSSMNTPGTDLRKAVDSLLTEEMKADVGSNNCGLYDLIGVLTHSGASADSGHYQAWMKAPAGDDWYRFNDDKVSIVDKDKITSLAGGGESDSIYIGLYKSKY